ncbi:mechanosensitive ion channel family protein [Brucella pituitosa]|uniref:Small-conductance mechanosensitive channel n=1 Tax=Brucella pituitosa TaxID=571256 RepID=A0A643EWD2_9HYPH|nr:mechanosensitive ion channel family protein [Brucella pituitosa]KAB0569361.1 mechanosensitive ion channel family protein [Brucella pituitosa]
MFATPNSISFLIVNMLGVAGIIVWHLQGASRPTARLIVQIGFFSAMTLLFVNGGVLPHRLETGTGLNSAVILDMSARLLWWVHLAWASIGFVRLYIFLDHRPQEARLIQDLIVAGVYLGVSLSIVGFVFQAPVGTLVATSGVVAIIIGLALQNTLGDLFSGIALTLGRPFSIGDWIQLADGTEGHVVENNWRSTQVLTPFNNLVVLPNSTLAKLGLINLSRPDETHLIILPIRIAFHSRPADVETILKAALMRCHRIVQSPAPIVALKGIDALAIDVELQFRVAGPAARTPARNEIIDVVHQHCTANGLSLAMPVLSYVLPVVKPHKTPSVA